MGNNYPERLFWNDRKFEQGLKELAAECIVPDEMEAYLAYKKRIKRNSYLKAMVAAVLILMFVVVVIPGPAMAFGGYLRKTITQMLDKTTKLIQRVEGETKIVTGDARKSFATLSELAADPIAKPLLPQRLTDSQFESAEIVYGLNANTVYAMNYILILNESPIHLKIMFTSSSGRFYDIEDYNTTSLMMNNREITVAKGDKDITVIEWELGPYLYTMSGNVLREELIDFALSIGLFD